MLGICTLDLLGQLRSNPHLSRQNYSPEFLLFVCCCPPALGFRLGDDNLEATRYRPRWRRSAVEAVSTVDTVDAANPCPGSPVIAITRWQSQRYALIPLHQEYPAPPKSITRELPSWSHLLSHTSLGRRCSSPRSSACMKRCSRFELFLLPFPFLVASWFSA